LSKQAVHIAISVLVGSCLLFGQLGAIYLHTRHDEHKAEVGKTENTVIIAHGEHCKICAVDVFNQQFEAVVNSYLVYHSPSVFAYQQEIFAPFNYLLLFNGRAPPAI